MGQGTDGNRAREEVGQAGGGIVGDGHGAEGVLGDAYPDTPRSIGKVHGHEHHHLVGLA